MKKNKFILLTCFGLLFFLNACQAAKDGLTGKKKNDTDEFLVQKKNPLVLPPDYNDLPIPKSDKKNQEELNKDNNDDIKKLVEAGTEESSSNNKSSSDQSLENSILKTLNDN